MTPRVVTTQYVIQLVPYVKGQVTKVHAKANVPIKKGDLLLEINPAPYQYALDQAVAQLQVSQEGLKQAEAGVNVAKAGVAQCRGWYPTGQCSGQPIKSRCFQCNGWHHQGQCGSGQF